MMRAESMFIRGKSVVITEATTALGRATAEGLAKMGASLVLVGGDRVQLSSAAERVKRDFPDTMLKTLVADLSSMMEVRRSASEIMSEQHRIDVLINNVGTAAQIREVTVDGYERTFALGHLAPFLLTNLLLASLRSSAPSRIITVSSSPYRAGSLNLDDLMLERGYSTSRACGQAKLANILFTCELAQRLQGTGVTANFVGLRAGRTRFGIEACGTAHLDMVAVRPFELSWMSGVRTTIYLAASPEAEGLTGRCFTGMRPRRPARASYDREAARMLWEVSERLTGLRTG
jgi:NAD(P)-dependent dehydrogenase (short-subunit alcohol dehydrogenase family)